MSERLKIKYRSYCEDVQLFYKIMDEWESFLIANPVATKEEKLKKIEEFKVSAPNLHQIMMEDINETRN